MRPLHSVDSHYSVLISGFSISFLVSYSPELLIWKQASWYIVDILTVGLSMYALTEIFTCIYKFPPIVILHVWFLRFSHQHLLLIFYFYQENQENLSVPSNC